MQVEKMNKQQLLTFIVSAICFLFVILIGIVMDGSMGKVNAQFAFMTTALANLYVGLKGFVSTTVDTPQNK